MSHDTLEVERIQIAAKTITEKFAAYMQQKNEEPKEIFSASFYFNDEGATHSFSEDSTNFHDLITKKYGATSKVFQMGGKKVGVGVYSMRVWLLSCYSELIVNLESEKSLDSVVIFFYAGHGGFRFPDTYCLSGQDDNKQDKSVSFDDISTILESQLTNLKFRGTLLYILDCCYSEGAARSSPDYAIHYLCAADIKSKAKSFNSLAHENTNFFKLEGLGQFTTALISILNNATNSIDITSVVDQLLERHLNDDGALRVQPIFKTRQNGNETRRFYLTPIGCTAIATVNNKTPRRVALRLHLLVPEDLNKIDSEEFVSGFVKQGAEVVDAYLGASTHFIMNVPISLATKLQMIAPNNIVSIEPFRRQIRIRFIFNSKDLDVE